MTDHLVYEALRDALRAEEPVALATVTGLPLMELSASIGKVVAVLALLPPWILIYLVSGRRGLNDGWPLAIVGSLGYIAGQFPVSN